MSSRPRKFGGFRVIGENQSKAYLWESSFGEDTAAGLAYTLVVMVAAELDARRLMGTHINKQVLPQAPSPTMTSFRRISAIVGVD